MFELQRQLAEALRDERYEDIPEIQAKIDKLAAIYNDFFGDENT